LRLTIKDLCLQGFFSEIFIRCYNLLMPIKKELKSCLTIIKERISTTEGSDKEKLIYMHSVGIIYLSEYDLENEILLIKIDRFCDLIRDEL